MKEVIDRDKENWAEFVFSGTSAESGEKAWLFSFLPQDGAIGMSSGMKGPLSRMPAPCLYSLIQRDQKTAGLNAGLGQAGARHNWGA